MDPNRYAKNKDIRPDGPLLIIRSLIVMSLVIIGITGLAVHLFGNGSTLMASVEWLQSSWIHVLMVFAIIIAMFKFHDYISHVVTEKQRRASNYPMYIMVLIGLYFTIQLIKTGHW